MGALKHVKPKSTSRCVTCLNSQKANMCALKKFCLTDTCAINKLKKEIWFGSGSDWLFVLSTRWLNDVGIA